MRVTTGEQWSARKTAARLVAVVRGVVLSVTALGWPAAASAQQQTDTPPDPKSSPLIQPSGVVASQCPQPLAHVNVGSTVASGDWVELQRTACQGSCVAYTVRLGADGSVTWHGDRYVAVTGNAAAQVDAARAANLIQQLRDHDFAGLCGSYTQPVTDQPTYITTVSIAGRAQRVSDYARSAPAWLRDFDERVDATADTHRWRHGDPASEYFGNKHLVEDVQLPKPDRTQLMRAAGTVNGAVQLLLAQKVAVDAEDASGWTALMYAAGAGSLDQVQELLAAGASASHLSRAGESVLSAAAGSADNPVRKLVLLQRSGASVAAGASDGTTVLMIAATRYQQPEILRTVLAMGANPAVKNARGQTALQVLEKARVVGGAPGAYEVARAMLLAAH